MWWTAMWCGVCDERETTDYGLHRAALGGVGGGSPPVPKPISVPMPKPPTGHGKQYTAA